MTVLYGWLPGIKTITLIGVIRDQLGCRLIEAKGAVETLLHGGIVVVRRLDLPTKQLIIELGVAQTIDDAPSDVSEWLGAEMRGWAFESAARRVTDAPEDLVCAARTAPGWIGLSTALRCIQIDKKNEIELRERLRSLLLLLRKERAHRELIESMIELRSES
jgi:hypothetical protein